MRILIVLALAGALAACANKAVVSTPPATCSRLIPDKWAGGVEATPVPDTSGLSPLDQIKAWAGAYVGMAGQLAKANGRTADTITIVTRCEELVNAARPS